MAKKAMSLTKVTCSDQSTDYFVGLNENTDTNDKVQAFVDAFKGVASTASSTCYGLPLKVILALWGAESGWGANSTQQKNQNWANMIYSSSTNPAGNVGKGTGGWAKFEGRSKFANGFARFLMDNSPYSSLITYLKNTSSPDINTCIDYIANAGYCAGDTKEFADLVKGCVSTLEKRSNIDG